jgi:hypothetical protein
MAIAAQPSFNNALTAHLRAAEVPISEFQRRFEITNFPVSSKAKVYDTFLQDTFVRDGSLQGLDYFLLADYAVINPDGVETPELKLIQSLDVDTFELLREAGLLLYNHASGEYLLMTAFRGVQLDPIGLLGIINEHVNKFQSALNYGASVNGLQAGVTNGSILDVEGYLNESRYAGSDSIAKLRRRIEGIFKYNITLLNRALSGENQDDAQMLIRAKANILEGDSQSRINILRVFEQRGDFVWSTVAITDIAQLDALFPGIYDTRQVNLDGVLRKNIARPIIAFIRSNPEWLNYYTDIIEYVKHRFSSIMLNLNYSDQNLGISIEKLYRMVEEEFRIELWNTAEM